LTKNPYLFQGQRLDPETGLYYFKNRYYDPVHGRFITRDPAGMADGPNLYAFVNNNPVNNVDPLGLVQLPTFVLFTKSVSLGMFKYESEDRKFVLNILKQKEAVIVWKQEDGVRSRPRVGGNSS
jgi:RHS repeat-associated protein